MSEAMKCDRCGKYVDGNDIPAIRGWRTEAARRVGSPMLKVDLCDECYKALEDFLVNKKERWQIDVELANKLRRDMASQLGVPEEILLEKDESEEDKDDTTHNNG